MYRYWARPGPTYLPDSQSSLTERLISQYLQKSVRTTGRPRISSEIWPNDRQTENIFRNLAKRPADREYLHKSGQTTGRPRPLYTWPIDEWPRPLYTWPTDKWPRPLHTWPTDEWPKPLET